MLDLSEQPPKIEVHDLGRVAYEQADERQRAAHQALLDGEGPETLLVLECDPVITVSRRASAQTNILAEPGRLAELGIDVQPTDRGGDVTYHGPGQLVAYPVVRLAPRRLNVTRYMRLLETATVDALRDVGIAALRVEGCTGVWVDPRHATVDSIPARPPAAADADQPRACNTGLAKIAALGIRLRKNITLHGIALNVDPDLAHFDTIVPCGLTNRAVTSVRQVLGDAAPSLPAVKQLLIASLLCRLGEAQAQADRQSLVAKPGSEPTDASTSGNADA